jgi:hypothetical protein
MANNGKLKARTILDSAQGSADSFLKAFDTVRQARGATRGKPTHEEQDLLRASLVFAAAGLDSMLKQLIREAIRQLAATDVEVQAGLETFVQRKIRGDSEDAETISGYKFLASILISTSQQDRIIEEYIKELTGNSLQSQDQVFKTVNALGLDPTKSIELDPTELRSAFKVRNEIIHELDVNLNTAPGRSSRKNRTKEDLKKHTDTLLDAGGKILKAVEDKLKSNT